MGFFVQKINHVWFWRPLYYICICAEYFIFFHVSFLYFSWKVIKEKHILNICCFFKQSLANFKESDCIFFLDFIDLTAIGNVHKFCISSSKWQLFGPFLIFFRFSGKGMVPILQHIALKLTHSLFSRDLPCQMVRLQNF